MSPPRGPLERPGTLQINGWNPELRNSDRLPDRTPWGQQGEQVDRSGMRKSLLAPPALANQYDWRHPEVGWGLVLPDDPQMSAAEKAAAEDAAPALRRLLQARTGAPVLRWSPELGQRFLRRYYADGRAQDLTLAASAPGVGDGCIPRYLLIHASPVAIPWSVQYAMNMSHYVGRLDLADDQALDNYINALIDDWRDSVCHTDAPVVWSVNHGREDITWLMARAIADKVWQGFETDIELGRRIHLNGERATCGEIAAMLAERKPALVITTSHGMTAPLGDAALLKAQLGMPVDVNHQPLRTEALREWQPCGAIWYSHACCSAGSDSVSQFGTFLGADSSISQIVNGVAGTAGAVVAPLPRALLGCSKPLRAFVGHVEPTFDWTLRDPLSGQVLTHGLCNALYNELFQQERRTPIAYALRGMFDQAGTFHSQREAAIVDINKEVAWARNWALYLRLAALDRQTMVILGDPTVSLPPLG